MVQTCAAQREKVLLHLAGSHGFWPPIRQVLETRRIPPRLGEWLSLGAGRELEEPAPVPASHVHPFIQDPTPPASLPRLYHCDSSDAFLSGCPKLSLGFHTFYVSSTEFWLLFFSKLCSPDELFK